MTHKVCKYRLNSNGTIPDFICFDNNGFHGAFVVEDTLEPSPRAKLMIGITDRNATGDFEAIVSQADLEAYLTSVSSKICGQALASYIRFMLPRSYRHQDRQGKLKLSNQQPK